MKKISILLLTVSLILLIFVFIDYSPILIAISAILLICGTILRQQAKKKV